MIIKNLLKTILPSSLGLALVLSSACGQQESQTASEIKVTNGISASESAFPSTVLLVSVSEAGEGICTGTFVNDSQVVTAGHCVEGMRRENPNLFYVTLGADNEAIDSVRARSYRRNPNYSMEVNGGVNPSDLAIVNFPRRTAPAISRIATISPEVGTDITIVGYGNNRNFVTADDQLSGSGAGEKRYGVNQLAEIEEGFLTFYGLPEAQAGYASGEVVGAGAGDSGGPMFVGNEIVGVTSGGGLAETVDGLQVAVSHYVDLNSFESRAFLRRHLRR